MIKPRVYQSYDNIAHGMPAYHNFLTPASNGPNDKKTLINLPQSLPQIGTFRCPTNNFEKRELETGGTIASLAMDTAFHFMAVTEVRVEDYYLLRMCPVGSDLFNAASNTHPVPPFNRSLHHSASNVRPSLPDLNRPWPALPNNSNPILNPFSQHRNVSPNSPNFAGNAINAISQGNAINQVNQGNANGFNNNFDFHNSADNSSPRRLPPPSLTGNQQGGQFQTPRDRLANIFPNANNPNNSSNQLANSLKNLQDNAFARQSNASFPNNGNASLPNNNASFPNNINSFSNNTNSFSNNSSPSFQNNNISFPNNNISFTNSNQFSNNNTFPNNNIAVSQVPVSISQNPPSGIDFFLEYFYGGLTLVYSQGQNLRQTIQNFLKRCLIFSERAQEIKNLQKPETGTNRSPPISKKRKQCLEIKSIIDGLRLDLEGKVARQQSTPELLKYAQIIWEILQDIYEQRLGEGHLESRTFTVEEGTKDLSEKLMERESILINQIGTLDRERNPNLYQYQPLEALPTLSPARPYVPIAVPLPGYASVDPNAQQRSNLASQVLLINHLNLRLKELCQRERLQRQEHLYDCMRRNEPGDADEYQAYCKRKREQTDVMVVVVVESHKKSPTTASSIRSRTAKNELSSTPSPTATITKQPTVSVSQFESSPKSKELFTVCFKTTVVWVNKKRQEEKFKVFEGSFQMQEPVRRADIENYLKKQMELSCKGFLRTDAQFKFSDLQKQRDGFEIWLKIKQKKLNIPAAYNFEVKFATHDGTGVRLTALSIWNEHGRVEWGRVDITTFDFDRGEIQIGDNTFLCSSDCLNQPARITFFTLPAKIVQLREHYFQKEVEERLRKHVSKFMEMELESIDWKNGRYTITAKQFYSPVTDSAEEERVHAKQEEIKRDGERMDVREFRVTESVII